MEVVAAAGIGFTVARTWDEGTRDDERRPKNRGGASRVCPICRALAREARP